MKRIFVAVLLLVGLITAIRAQPPGSFIIPLRSVRSDLDRTYQLIRSEKWSAEYKFEDLTILVDLSSKPCIGHGWEVKKDVVISFTVKGPRLAVPEPRVDDGLFRMRTNSGSIFTIDRERGIIYDRQPGAEFASNIRYVPKGVDDSLRCAGFPKYDPRAASYDETETVSIATLIEYGGLRPNTIGRLRELPTYSGFIFVYCEPSRPSDCQTMLKLIEKRVRSITTGEALRVKVEVGGFRSSPEVQSFVIPENWPVPTALPTLTKR